MKVTITAHRMGNEAHIELDGVDITSATREAVLTMDASAQTSLRLTLVPEVVEVDGDIEPEQVEGLKHVVFHRKGSRP